MTYAPYRLVPILGLRAWQAMECESGRLVRCPIVRRDVIAARTEGR